MYCNKMEVNVTNNNLTGNTCKSNGMLCNSDDSLSQEDINNLIKNVFTNTIDDITAKNKNLSVSEIMLKVQNIINEKIRERSGGNLSIDGLKLDDIQIDEIKIVDKKDIDPAILERSSNFINDKYKEFINQKIQTNQQQNNQQHTNHQHTNQNNKSDNKPDTKSEDESDDELDKESEDEEKITLQKYLEDVESIDELRSMFISMILDLKERVKGCEQCETCSQVISIVESYIKEYKKISKLASLLANLFILIVENRMPAKLNTAQTKILELAFIMIMKNSNFSDVEYIYECFKGDGYININIYDGLAFRLAIQKHTNANIKKMISWGADITIRKHRPIIRAFHYEKFNVVKTLINAGSSYKYFLKAELDEEDHSKVLEKIDYILEKQILNSDINCNAKEKDREKDRDLDKEKEYLFIELIKKYIVIRKKENNKKNQIEDVDFIYDFLIHLDIYNECILNNAKYNAKDNDTNNDGNEKKKKKKKKKKTNKSKDPISNDPISNDPISNDPISNDPISNDIINNNTIELNNTSYTCNSEYDELNDDTFGDDNQEEFDIENTKCISESISESIGEIKENTDQHIEKHIEIHSKKIENNFVAIDETLDSSEHNYNHNFKNSFNNSFNYYYEHFNNVFLQYSPENQYIQYSRNIW